MATTITAAVVAIVLAASPATAQGSAYDDFQVGNVGAPNFSNDQVRTSLIVAGDDVPKGTKTYTAGIRSTKDGYNFCGGSLITHTHVLTASHCVTGNIRWVSIGSHYVNGTQDGEQIRVVSLMNHLNFSEAAFLSDDFVILELEKPSSFKPVKLAAADNSDFEVNASVSALGWGRTGQNETQPYELKHVKLQLWDHEKCGKMVADLGKHSIDDTMLCAGGEAGTGICYGDSGGPLIKESTTGEDVLIGVTSWLTTFCADVGTPYGFGRVSAARGWIDSFSGGSCLE